VLFDFLSLRSTAKRIGLAAQIPPLPLIKEARPMHMHNLEPARDSCRCNLHHSFWLPVVFTGPLREPWTREIVYDQNDKASAQKMRKNRTCLLRVSVFCASPLLIHWPVPQFRG
jgi:hypothetical protein